MEEVIKKEKERNETFAYGFREQSRERVIIGDTTKKKKKKWEAKRKQKSEIELTGRGKGKGKGEQTNK